MHASVKPIQNQIRIKTEHGTAESMRISKKKNVTKTLKNTKTQQKRASTSTTNWNQEKQRLIQKIVDCKAENQRNILNFKKMSCAYDAIRSEKLKAEQQHSEKMNTISSRLNAIQAELADAKIQHSKKESEFNSVLHENQTLKARVNQLQSNQQYTPSSSETNQNASKNQVDAYDIENIINHKKKKDGLHFRVRWANYSAKDDTWEHESNLMCTLCKYMRKKNLM